MGYYHGEQSVGLKPILIAVALVTAVLFGAAYYASGIQGNHQAPESAAVEPVPSPLPPNAGAVNTAGGSAEEPAKPLSETKRAVRHEPARSTHHSRRSSRQRHNRV